MTEMEILWAWVDKQGRAHFFGAWHPSADIAAEERDLVKVVITRDEFDLLEHGVRQHGDSYPRLADYGIILRL